MKKRMIVLFGGVAALWVLVAPAPMCIDGMMGPADAGAQIDVPQRVTMLKGARPAPEEPTRRFYFTSYDGNERDWHTVRRRLHEAGAWRINGFFPDAIVCELPVSIDPWSIVSGTGLTATPQESMTDARADAGPERIRSIQRAYKTIDARREAAPHQHVAPPYLPADDGDPTVELVPAVPLDQVRRGMRDGRPGGERSAGQSGDERLFYQNTEFLSGNILIRIIFPESKGGGQETWTNLAKQQAEQAIKVALDYFDRHFRNVDLNYDYHRLTVDTEYEPINMQLLVTDYGLWVDDVMTRLGDGGADGIIAKVHRFNQALRPYFPLSDWVFTVFVVNGENDEDHYFDDNKRKVRAELGGPFMILPFSTLTTDAFEAFFLYSMSVLFWGTPEEEGSAWGCGDFSGYLNIKNGNKNKSDPLGMIFDCSKNFAEDCVACMLTMETAMWGWAYDGPPCVWTYGQLGYRDNNSNSVPDVLDSPPAIVWNNAYRETLLTFDQEIKFSAVSQAVQNKNSIAAQYGPLRNYLTPIRNVSYSLNNGGAIFLQPLDGDFDDPVEDFELKLSFLFPGNSTVEVWATNVYSAKSQGYSKEVFYIGLDFDSFRIEYPNNGIGLAWYTRGQTFGAGFRLLRIDYGVEPAVVDTVAWPDDLQPVSQPQDGLTPYYFLDKSVVPGSDYGYVVEGQFDLYYAPDQVVRTFTSASDEVRTFAPIPRTGMMSDPAPNPFTPGENEKTLVSVNIPGARGLALFSRGGGGPTRAAGQAGMDEVEPIGLNVGVYDVAGRRIRELFNAQVYTQVVNVDWDGRNYKGDVVPTGMYFIKATVGDVSDSKKILILR